MFKCNSKNPKFKNLTIGKAYEGEVSNDDFVEITNDAGVKSKYHKKYFSKVIEEAQRPAPRRTIRNLFLTDILAMLNIHYVESDGNDNNRVNVNYNSVDYPMYADWARNTCGVIELDGMNNIADLVIAVLTSIDGDTSLNTAVTSAELFNAVMISIINELDDQLEKPFYMLTTDNPDREMFSLFTIGVTASTNCFKSIAKVNPGSDNEIAIWIIDSEEYLSNK